MKVATRKEGAAVAILDVEGRLVISTETNGLHTAIDDLLDLGINKVVLNLSGVSYLDCSGIGQLLACREKVKNQEGVLRITGLNSRLDTLIEIFGLSSVLGVCESEREAVAGFFRPPSIDFADLPELQTQSYVPNGRNTSWSLLAPTGT
jgi:anti-anti-sigma factor